MFLQKNNPKAPPLEFGAVSKEDLLNMGAQSIAYIKSSDGGDGFKVYAANGVLLEVQPDMKDAFNEIRAKNMVCATVH